MSWITKHPRIWRTAGLVLMLVAISGPWGFDRIHVPAQYPCSAPNVRLEGDFCGLPLSLTYSLLGFFGDLRGTVSTLVRYPLSVLSILPLLPILSTLLLLLPGRRSRSLWFHLAALSLGALATLFVAGLGFSLANWALGVAWMLWGLWLYVAVTTALLLFEVLTFRRRGTPAPGQTQLAA